MSRVIVMEKTPSESASILETPYLSPSGSRNFFMFKISGLVFRILKNNNNKVKVMSKNAVYFSARIPVCDGENLYEPYFFISLTLNPVFFRIDVTASRS